VECQPCFSSIAIEVRNGIGCGKLAMVYFVAIEVSNHCGMLAMVCFVAIQVSNHCGMLAMVCFVAIQVSRRNRT
jgi:uncharacterized radical SAM superfamily Fe-S cluster-containing enzyme